MGLRISLKTSSSFANPKNKTCTSPVSVATSVCQVIKALNSVSQGVVVPVTALKVHFLKPLKLQPLKTGLITPII